MARAKSTNRQGERKEGATAPPRLAGPAPGEPQPDRLDPEGVQREVRVWAEKTVRKHLKFEWIEKVERELLHHLAKAANPARERDIINGLIDAVNEAVRVARERIARLQAEGHWSARWDSVQLPVLLLDDFSLRDDSPEERKRVARVRYALATGQLHPRPYQVEGLIPRVDDLRRIPQVPDRRMKYLDPTEHERDRLVLFLRNFPNLLSIDAWQAMRAGVPDSAFAAVFLLLQPVSFFPHRASRSRKRFTCAKGVGERAMQRIAP